MMDYFSVFVFFLLICVITQMMYYHTNDGYYGVIEYYDHMSCYDVYVFLLICVIITQMMYYNTDDGYYGVI